MPRFFPILFCLLLTQAAKTADTIDDSFDVLLQRAEAQVAASHWAEAAQAYEQAQRVGQLSGGDAYNYACVLALSGQKEAAIKTLSLAVERGFVNVAHMQKDPDISTVRDDARFPVLMKRAESLVATEKRLYEAVAFETSFAAQLSEAERIAGLSRLWSEAKYNFANFDLVPDLDWDALYLQTIPKVQQADSTLAYYQELIRFVARLHDGHTNVYAPNELADAMYARPALRTRLIDNRVLVTRVLSDELATQGFRVGTEILMVDDIPVHDYAREIVAPMASASTPQDLNTRMFNYQLLQGSSERPLRLRIQNAKEKPRDVVLQRLTQKERAALSATNTPSFEWKMLAGNIAWVALNEFGSNTAADEYIKNFDAISKANAIIFDVRHNGGGNSTVGYRVLATLSDKTFATSRWETRKYVPTWRPWGRLQMTEGDTGSSLADMQHQYKGKVVVLTSSETYSAAEDFAGAFKQMQRGKLVGEASGGSTGQPLFIKLPGGGSARICSKRDRLADGTEFVGKGIQVDVPAHETVNGFRAGKDEVLDAAIALLTK